MKPLTLYFTLAAGLLLALALEFGLFSYETSEAASAVLNIEYVMFSVFLPVILSVKGTVQRQLRGVKSGINRTAL